MKKLVIASLLLIPSLSYAQPGRVSTEPSMTARDPITGFVVASIGDSTNNAIRVNCVTGCGSGGGVGTDVNLAEYIGVALGAGNAIHVQPGTGAVFSFNFATTTALGGTIASPTTALVGGFNYYYNNTGSSWLPWAGYDVLVGLAEEQAPAVGMYALVDNVTTDGINENQIGLVRMSINRNQHIQIRDNAGNERGVNVNAASELQVNATVNNDAVGEAIAVRCVSTDGSTFEACGGAGGGGGGTSQADNSAVTTITGTGALFDTTPPAITDGNVGLPRMSTDRYLYTIFPAGVPQTVTVDGTVIVDAEGSNVVINDSTLTPINGSNANPVGTERGLIVRNIPSGTQTVTGTVSALQDGTWIVEASLSSNPTTHIGDVEIINAAGAAAVNIQDGGNSITIDGTVAVSGTVTVNTHDVGSITTAVVPGTGATNLGKAEDSAHATTHTGVAQLSVAVDGGTVTEFVDAASDYSPVAVDRQGVLYARQDHPNSFNCGLDNISTTLTQCQAAPAAGFSIYITTVVAGSTTATAGQFLLRRGTGTNCGTGTASVLPSAATVARIASAANTAAGGPTVIPFMTPLKVAAANALCVLGVATNTTWIQITGFIAR